MPKYAGEKLPGKVVGDALVKSVSEKKHKLRYMDAYAVSERQLVEAKAAGAKIVSLTVKETGEVLRITIDKLLNCGRRIQHAGFEVQVALPVARWDYEVPGQEGLFDG